MLFDDDISDYESVPLAIVEESLQSNNCLSSQIADKFNSLIINFKPSAAVEFLDSLLLHIREGPKETRKFTETICKYLFAFKYAVLQEQNVDELCYEHLRKVLVAYCILKLRLISCVDDESSEASEIFLKITMLMKRSTSVTVMDILIDLIEEIHDSVATSVIKIICRKYLTMTLVGGPSVLADTDFVKHLVLFRSWYDAAPYTEKLIVLKFFMSTIKPSQEFGSNPLYSFLRIYDADEEGDYKKLINEPLPRNTLVRALRGAKSADYEATNQNIICSDMLYDNKANPKIQRALPLNVSEEIIIIDDDNNDITEISYLPKLFENLDKIKMYERRLELTQVENAPNVSETIIIDLTLDDEDANAGVTLTNVDNQGQSVTDVESNLVKSTPQPRIRKTSAVYTFEVYHYGRSGDLPPVSTQNKRRTSTRSLPPTGNRIQRKRKKLCTVDIPKVTKTKRTKKNKKLKNEKLRTNQIHVTRQLKENLRTVKKGKFQINLSRNDDAIKEAKKRMSSNNVSSNNGLFNCSVALQKLNGTQLAEMVNNSEQSTQIAEIVTSMVDRQEVASSNDTVDEYTQVTDFILDSISSTPPQVYNDSKDELAALLGTVEEVASCCRYTANYPTNYEFKSEPLCDNIPSPLYSPVRKRTN